MKVHELAVVIDGAVVATVERGSRGTWLLTYANTWLESPSAHPLSLSMPLAACEHGQRPLEAYIWGLLPDNHGVLERWGQRYQVSPRNPFALIAHVGEDCAGAAQFVRPDRLSSLTANNRGAVQWLDEHDIALRLAALRHDAGAWRHPADAGQFSLAGAQPKTALLHMDGRWGVPSGRIPTTHILKPPLAQFDGHVENEHFCLRLARAAGLPAARSKVERFEHEIAIVIERYDRVFTTETRVGDLGELAPQIVRVHQEDFCQALGVGPTLKYQNEGGPSPEAIVAVIRANSRRPLDDVHSFFDALAFHWVIGGTDAHAKNYGLLHGSGPAVRLAPLYDLASALPYDHLPLGSLKLAMKVGGEYRFRYVTANKWRKAGIDLAIGSDAAVERATALAGRVAAAVEGVHEACHREGLVHPIVGCLAKLVRERALRCRDSLSRSSTSD